MMRSTTFRTGSVDTFSEEASVQLDEPVLATQQFYPCNYWKSGPLGFGRLTRKVFGKARLDDRLPGFNLLVVTATRVAVFGVKFSYRSGVTLSGPHGTWQRSAVTATKKRVKLVSGGSPDASGNYTPRHEQTFMRLSLLTPDGELGADMLSPGSRRTQQVGRELAAK
jgi:hypothetical protein